MIPTKTTTGPILLTGATGQVGGELLNTLSPLGEVIAPLRSTLDLINLQSIRDTIRTLRPRWIVNPAAYTAVDKAETEPDLAYAINRDAVRVIGEEAATIGAGVIHFSTDYVFDGTGTKPYVETDPTNPVSVYGASKLAGEQTLAQSGAAHLIFRTSWVYGARGKNFLLTILKLAREREHLRVIGDQYGAPTWSRDLAQMTAHVIDQAEAAANGQNLTAPLVDSSGVYHISGAGETTWYGFAAEAVRQQREREPGIRFAEIEAIPATEYPLPAKRPANSRLNCTKLQQRFNWRMPNWHESLQKVLAEL
ncbi:dTDP-4-dehydrorhamnose reductase [Edaphobacter aggregans]|uniref:dTDP-4-dehydrorhamnose reductase n=1 Tax=Edaphobacter aggregans TaxID=570835 RepID=A0A428MI50_9BACT|nr:dTDP-4-dehydrorhamnose reductase [Edaphobacter aggregans]RSL16413.1 dTDP-4-dehydrorhamnose reductase [Edaphobacter aggregans]